MLGSRPHLKNINSDPTMSGMIKKAFRSGDNYMGKQTKEFEPDIPISGVGISAQHCLIKYDEESNQTMIYPNSEDPEKYSIKVNGTQLVTEPVALNHGDRILVGTHHYWLFTDPAVDADHMVEWEAAMKEANADSMKIMEQDNGELEEMKRQAEIMMKEREEKEREMQEQMRKFAEMKKQ